MQTAQRQQIPAVFLFLVCNLLTRSIVWAAHNYLPNSTLILVTYSSEKQGRKFWFDFSIQHIYFQFENSKSFNIVLVTKGELGKKNQNEK